MRLSALWERVSLRNEMREQIDPELVNQALNAAYERLERETREILYGGAPDDRVVAYPEVRMQVEREVLVAQEPRLFQLLTIPGQASYACPPEVTRISELWIEDVHRYLLYQISSDDLARNNLGVQARPLYFSFFNQHLHLYPIPDREYRVGFIQHERGGLNYAELSRVTREAFMPRLHVQRYMGRYGNSVDQDAARQKSLELLKSWLDPEQLAEFESTKSFVVTGSRSKRRYVIHQSTAYNVNEDGKYEKLCFVPDGADSVGDIMLAQKIMLENDEPRALNIANRANRQT